MQAESYSFVSCIIWIHLCMSGFWLIPTYPMTVPLYLAIDSNWCMMQPYALQSWCMDTRSYFVPGRCGLCLGNGWGCGRCCRDGQKWQIGCTRICSDSSICTPLPWQQAAFCHICDAMWQWPGGWVPQVSNCNCLLDPVMISHSTVHKGRV